jgi:hypothetical protein
MLINPVRHHVVTVQLVCSLRLTAQWIVPHVQLVRFNPSPDSHYVLTVYPVCTPLFQVAPHVYHVILVHSVTLLAVQVVLVVVLVSFKINPLSQHVVLVHWGNFQHPSLPYHVVPAQLVHLPMSLVPPSAHHAPLDVLRPYQDSQHVSTVHLVTLWQLMVHRHVLNVLLVLLLQTTEPSHAHHAPLVRLSHSPDGWCVTHVHSVQPPTSHHN